MSRARQATAVHRWPAGLVFGLLLTIGAGAASAEADGPDYYVVRGVAAGDVLHILAEPNPHAPPVGQIPPQGTCIRNLGCRGGLMFAEFSTLSPAEQERRTRAHPRWCQVEYLGVTGWVAWRYLAEGSDPGAVSRTVECR